MGKPDLPDDYDEKGDRGSVWVNLPRRKTFEERAQATTERVRAGDMKPFEDIRVSNRELALALGGIEAMEAYSCAELVEDFKAFQRELDRENAKNIPTQIIGPERQLPASVQVRPH